MTKHVNSLQPVHQPRQLGHPVADMVAMRGMIADYDLQTSLCELIDNALDFWGETERRAGLKIEISLDTGRQIILVKDNAGGVNESDLRLLIAPGASCDRSHANLIGIFGVGASGRA